VCFSDWLLDPFPANDDQFHDFPDAQCRRSDAVASGMSSSRGALGLPFGRHSARTKRVDWQKIECRNLRSPFDEFPGEMMEILVLTSAWESKPPLRMYWNENTHI
jgi:hypothetical protein